MIQAAIWEINDDQQKRKLRIQSGIDDKCEKWFNVGCVLKEELKGIAGGLDLEYRGGEESKTIPSFCLEQHDRWWCHLMKWARLGEERAWGRKSKIFFED